MTDEELQKRIERLNRRIKFDEICLRVIEIIMISLVIFLLFVIF